MRRAITLIIVLSVIGFGTSVWVDITQRNTAREYLDGLGIVREAVQQGRMDDASNEQAYLHAKWQHDSTWLNCITSHHHTRAVNTAMTELATAFENDWTDEALRALDKAVDALGDIESSDFAKLENVL